MVGALSPQDRLQLNDALKEARHKTSVKISIVARPSSASYDAYIIIFGLVVGTLLAYGLWQTWVITFYPWLLALQLGTVALFDLVHHISHRLMWVVPRRIRQKHANQEAMRAYHILHAHLHNPEPFVLLFVSLAERYVHVVTDPIVHAKVPDDWHLVTQSFTREMRAKGLESACLAAVGRIADTVAPSFPI